MEEYLIVAHYHLSTLHIRYTLKAGTVYVTNSYFHFCHWSTVVPLKMGPYQKVQFDAAKLPLQFSQYICSPFLLFLSYIISYTQNENNYTIIVILKAFSIKIPKVNCRLWFVRLMVYFNIFRYLANDRAENGNTKNITHSNSIFKNAFYDVLNKTRQR